MNFLKTEPELLERPFPPIAVDDLLVDGSLVMLVSPPGLGKTFTALDLALSMASNQPMWLGHPLRVHGPVIQSRTV